MSYFLPQASIHVILGHAANLNLELEQRDVGTAFHYSDLKKDNTCNRMEKRMKRKKKNENMVCKLKKKIVWVEARTKAMVQEIPLINGTAWLP